MTRVRPWVAVSLAGGILAVSVLTGSLWRPLPGWVKSWGAFGWPCLVNGRWWTLFSSLLLTRDPFMAVTMAAAVGAAVGVYERRAGHGRGLAVAAVGHLTGSVVLAVGAALAGRSGWPVAVHAAHSVDYGASMVVAAALGALSARGRGLRVLVVPGAVLALAVHHEFADWAHLVAAPAGFLVDRARGVSSAAFALAATAVVVAWLGSGGWRLVA
jgi:hypothetical protein